MGQPTVSRSYVPARRLCRRPTKFDQRHLWIIGSALFLSGMFAFISASLSQTATEYQVKAAFLYNFTKFIEWPATSFSGPSDPFTLCVYGTNPFGGSLESLVKGKTIDGREFAVRDVENASQAQGCQVLFISRTQHGHVADILAAVRSNRFADRRGDERLFGGRRRYQLRSGIQSR